VFNQRGAQQLSAVAGWSVWQMLRRVAGCWRGDVPFDAALRLISLNRDAPL
jgi:hypothetical protein